jgi:hypothetical protein
MAHIFSCVLTRSLTPRPAIYTVHAKSESFSMVSGGPCSMMMGGTLPFVSLLTDASDYARGRRGNQLPPPVYIYISQ